MASGLWPKVQTLGSQTLFGERSAGRHGGACEALEQLMRGGPQVRIGVNAAIHHLCYLLGALVWGPTQPSRLIYIYT